MAEKVNYFKVGKFVTTRGLKGELKVYSHTDNIERFLDLKSFYVGNNRDELFNVERVSILSPNMVVLKIKGFDTIESVQRFINKFIYVSREDVYALDEDEMLIVDMLGMSVVTVEGEAIGELVDVLQYTANDVYVVKHESGKEYLIPATYEIVPEINIKENKIVVDPIPGLLD